MITKDTIYVTKDVKRKTEERIEYLNTVKRRELAEETKVALGFGDVAENSEYLAVREEVMKVENEVTDLKIKLHNMFVIDESKIDKSKISVGARVTLKDLEFGEDEDFRLIGDREDHESEKDVSISSPMGRAMLGKKVGDTVEVNAPSGIYKLKVIKVIYG